MVFTSKSKAEAPEVNNKDTKMTSLTSFSCPDCPPQAQPTPRTNASTAKFGEYVESMCFPVYIHIYIKIYIYIYIYICVCALPVITTVALWQLMYLGT